MSQLRKLEGQSYDAIVIGAGINGASCAQQLAAAGYRCLVLDKGDFGSGATEKSARMLHIGLRFFEAENPVKHFLLHPGLFLSALRGGRQSMLGVKEHLANPGKRILPYRMCFPVYKDSGFKTWHIRSGLKMLELLGDKDVSIDPDVVQGNFQEKVPFFSDLRDQDKLLSIACYNEFKFDWPERFCTDMLLDAEKNSSVLVNYCAALIRERLPNGDWLVALRDTLNADASEVEVTAPLVLNMAGTWADEVLPPDEDRKSIVHKTKGSHIVVEMPEMYKGFGIASVNRDGLPFYILPFNKNRFSVGVTELPFDGDASAVTCSDAEVDFLIEESNTLLPGRKLGRGDVISTWSGVRPLTYSEDPLGTRVRKVRDLASMGYPGVISVTGGPIMSHRSTGRLVLDLVRTKSKPSGNVTIPNSEPFEFSDATQSEAFVPVEPEIRVKDIENSVNHEHAKTLVDVLVRRTALAWRQRVSEPDAQRAAKVVAPLLNWSESEQVSQVEQFIHYQNTAFRVPDNPGTAE